MPGHLRNKIPYNEFDYQALLSALSEYRQPRDRITKLLRQGTIIRVKKGLYVFGENDVRGVVHKEILANLIYGPSYVSLDYALHYHGLIPERVEALTSVTVNRAREFTTPLGRFVYRKIPLMAFRAGVDQVAVGQERAFLMANPEKALADKLYSNRVSISTQKDLRNYLLEGMRIEMENLLTLKPVLLHDYAERFRSRKIRLLGSVVERLIKSEGGRPDA